MLQILLVEDAPEYQLMVKKALAGKARMTVAQTLAEARLELSKNQFDVVVLDASLPDGSGFDFCSEIQQKFSPTDKPPVVMLTGKSEVTDRLHGWSAGVDDYITKPFHALEFELRVLSKAQKHKNRLEQDQVLEWKGLRLNLTFHEAYLTEGGKEEKLNLTPHEFKILQYLLKHRDHVVTRTQIIDAAWGVNTHLTERTVDKHISMLRSKLGPYGDNIKTVVGFGYRFFSDALKA